LITFVKHCNYQVLLNRITMCLLHLKYLVDHNYVNNSKHSTIITTTSWAAEFLALPLGSIPALQVTQCYITHPRTTCWLSNEGLCNIKNWIENVGPAGPFKPIEAQIKVLLEVIDTFPDQELEHYSKQLIYNRKTQCPAYWHNQTAASMGQSSDWMPPSPSTPGGRPPPAPTTSSHGFAKSILMWPSQLTHTQGMDTLQQEMDTNSHAKPPCLTLHCKLLPMHNELEVPVEPATQVNAY
jgi:hypothetical protein